MPASARQSQNVPSVPARSRNLVTTGNTTYQFAGLSGSPLTDRTVEPSSMGVLRRSPWTRWARASTVCLASGRALWMSVVIARVRVCSVWCTRLRTRALLSDCKTANPLNIGSGRRLQRRSILALIHAGRRQVRATREHRASGRLPVGGCAWASLRVGDALILGCGFQHHAVESSSARSRWISCHGVWLSE